MPRGPRVKSESGVYHVMLRGIDQSQLFYDDDDRHEFLSRLLRFKRACGYNLYAYCIMDNHVHLLIKEQGHELSEIVKRLATSYAQFYNAKYDRRGFVFEGRYKSEPVENESYLLELVRYIHNNPIKIGRPVEYWTSYSEYLQKPNLVDTKFILCMFSHDHQSALRLFKEFIFDGTNAEATQNTLSSCTRARINDADALELIKNIAGISYASDLAKMDKNARNYALASLKERGLSIRKLARLTGINRGLVQLARK